MRSIICFTTFLLISDCLAGDDMFNSVADSCAMPAMDMSDRGASQPDPAALAREKHASVYLSIISQQTFIGCWKLNTELSQLLDVSLDQLQNSSPVKVSYTYCLRNMQL